MSRIASALAAVAVALAARGSDPTPFMGVLRVENPAHLIVRPGAVRVRIALDPDATERADELRARFPMTRLERGALVVEVEAYVPLSVPPGLADRAATFLVDFDEPVFVGLQKTVVERFGKQPTAGQLELFVGEYISRKNYSRGLDLASQTAARREGDCSEHAVLLVALARLFGLPARIVIGLGLSTQGEDAMAVGHAWAEIHDGASWHPFDAIGLTVIALRIPLATVRNEGPGYAFGILQLLHPAHVVSVSLLPPASDH